MKTVHIFTALALVGLLLAMSMSSAGAAPSETLVISQVVYDHATPPSEPAREWVEIYNLSSSVIDLTNYKIGDEETSGGGEGMYYFPSGATIAPRQKMVIAVNATDFFDLFGYNPDFEFTNTDPTVPTLAKYTGWATGNLGLSNSSDEVLLLNDTDAVVDAVLWGGSTRLGTIPHSGVAEGHSLRRAPINQDTDDCSVDFTDESNPTPSEVVHVSQPSYLTDNSAYDRNPSPYFDGTNYWVFYTKGDDTSTGGMRGGGYDPDTDSYVIYYKAAASIAGLTGATETKLALSESARPLNFHQRVADGIVFSNGDMLVVTSSGQEGPNRNFYRYNYTAATTSWSGPIQIVPTSGTISGGHVDLAYDGSTIYMVWEDGSGSSAFSQSADGGSTWSTPTTISTDNMPKIEVDAGGKLYVIGIDVGTGDINLYTSTTGGASWNGPAVVFPGAGLYDPTIVVHGSELYAFTAPYDGGDDRQQLIASMSTDGGTTWSSPTVVTNGGYDSTYWWDYWPEALSDGSDVYLFYTTEKDGPALGDGEIAAFKVDWPLSHHHYEAIQPAVDNVAGSTVNVAAGTYDGFMVDSKTDLTVVGSGAPVISGAKVNVSGLTTGSCPAGMDALVAVESSTNVTIQGFVIDASGYLPNCFYGVIYYQSSGTVKENTIQNIEGTGGQSRGGIRAQAGTSLAILDNTISEYDKSGIVSRAMDSIDIERNIITTTYDGTAPNGIDIGTYAGTAATIKDNDISGADYDQFDAGEYEVEWSGAAILVIEAGGNLDISGNTIQNSDVGLDIESDSATITNNDLSSNLYGVVLWNANPVINFNSIQGSASYGVYRTSGGDLGGIVDASGNWWGANDPTGVAAAVSPNVDYTPWLDNGSDTSGDPGFQGDFSILHVDDDSPQTGSTGRIQEGVDMVSGSTVYVAAGTYPASVTIDKSVDIIGAGSASTFLTSGIVIGGSFDGLTLEGMTLSGDGLGPKNAVIDSRPTTGPVSDITIRNCVLDGENTAGRGAFYGHYIAGDWTWEGNEIKNFTYWYLIDNTGSSHDVPYKLDTVTWDNNHVHHVSGSVAIRGKIDDPTDLVIVKNSTFDQYVDNSCCGGWIWAAIEVNNASEVRVYNNIIRDVPQQGSEGQALQIWSATPWTVDIHNNEMNSNYEGIWVVGFLPGTDWSGSDTPLYVPGGSIYHNNFGNTNFGLWISDVPPGSGTSSAIGGPLDARNNWWGAADGPSGVGPGSGDSVSANALFCPWLDAPSPGGSPTSNGGLVTNLDTGELFCNIKPAVEHPTTLDGHTLEASAGTFVEEGQIVIDKDLTIRGESPDTTIVKTDSDTGSSGDSRGWFLVQPGIELHLSDLTLDGSGHLVYQAIRHRGEGTINNVNFTEIKFNESGPHYSGVGVAAFGAGPVDITNSTFTEMGRIGVLYFGSGVSGSTFSGNTYVGKGDGDWLDYALDIGAGAVVDVSNNTISDNRGVASVDGSTSAGILVTTYYGGGTGAAISENVISDCSDGIHVGYGDTDTSLVTMDYNELFGNDNGIMVRSAANVEIGDNYIHDNEDGIDIRGTSSSTITDNDLRWSSQAHVRFSNSEGGRNIQSLLTGNYTNGPGFASIVVDKPYPANYDITIGADPNSPNIFYNPGPYGKIYLSGDGWQDGETIPATYNDFIVRPIDAIEYWIHHQVDDPSLGEVIYYGIEVEADPGSVPADGVSASTITGRLTGLLAPAGNRIDFAATLGNLSVPSGAVDAGGETSVTLTSTDTGTADVDATADSFRNPKTATTQVTFTQPVLTHFTFDSISDQAVDEWFEITIQAMSNAVPFDFDGNVTLSDTTGTIAPTTAPLVDGVWTGQVKIGVAANNVVITAQNGGVTGDSNAFDVLDPPSIKQFIFDSIADQMAGQPFLVTIGAESDDAGGLSASEVVDFNGYATLSDTTGTINPTLAGPFEHGVWTGEVTIGAAANDVVITATDSQDAAVLGVSQPFNVATTAGSNQNFIYLPLIVKP